MSTFYFHALELKGAYIIENFHSGDNRGGFIKLFEKEIFRRVGIDFHLDETFASTSEKNVIRGLHFQKHNPQAKLVAVLNGIVWDVIVDLRPGSATYSKWISVELSSENHKGLYIPRGFAHGFVSLVDNTVMLYQCDGAYDAESDSGIKYNDTDIGIDWPIDLNSSIHSQRDLALPSFKEYEKNPIIV